jgi:hypothetical protein
MPFKHLPWGEFELTTLVVIDTDCIGSYNSNYHTITTRTASIINVITIKWHLMLSGIVLPKFVSALRQVGSFLLFPPPIKLTPTI